MAFLDDVRASKTRLANAMTLADSEFAQAVTQLQGALVTRLRPLPTLSWVSDEILAEGCLAFATTLVKRATEDIS